jgi:hypothetical protein
MKFKIIFSIFSLACLVSCKKENMHERRFSVLDPFNKIELNSPFDVYLNESNSNSIEIIGYEEVIRNVTFSIDSNVLKIGNPSHSKWLTPRKNKIELYINSEQLSGVTANETCNINTLTPITSDKFGLVLASKANEANLELDNHNFYYWNNFPCGGKLILSGKTDELKIWNYAIMSVDAKNLIAKYALVENSSKGNCEVTVLNKLEYSIFGAGDIHLYGSPPEIIKIQVTSSGQLIQH